MATSFLTLSTAVRDAVTGAPALGKGKVLRGRGVSLPKDETKGVRINTLRHSAEPLDVAGDALQWDGLLQISVLGRASPTEDAEQAIDELLGQVWTRCAALTLPAGVVGGITLRPDITWAVDEADTTVTEATFTLRLNHITTAAALVAPAP